MAVASETQTEGAVEKYRAFFPLVREPIGFAAEDGGGGRSGRRKRGLEGFGIAQREQKGVAGLVEPGDLSRYPRASGRRLCIYACFAGIACFLPITRHSTWHTTRAHRASIFWPHRGRAVSTVS